MDQLMVEPCHTAGDASTAPANHRKRDYPRSPKKDVSSKPSKKMLGSPSKVKGTSPKSKTSLENGSSTNNAISSTLQRHTQVNKDMMPLTNDSLKKPCSSIIVNIKQEAIDEPEPSLSVQGNDSCVSNKNSSSPGKLSNNHPCHNSPNKSPLNSPKKSITNSSPKPPTTKSSANSPNKNSNTLYPDIKTELFFERKKYKRKTERDLLYKTLDDLWAKKGDIKTLVMQNFKETHFTRSSDRVSSPKPNLITEKKPIIKQTKPKLPSSSSQPQQSQNIKNTNKSTVQNKTQKNSVPPLKSKNMQNLQKKDKNPLVVKVCPDKNSIHKSKNVGKNHLVPLSAKSTSSSSQKPLLPSLNNSFLDPQLLADASKGNEGISLDHCYAKPHDLPNTFVIERVQKPSNNNWIRLPSWSDENSTKKPEMLSPQLMLKKLEIKSENLASFTNQSLSSAAPKNSASEGSKAKSSSHGEKLDEKENKTHPAGSSALNSLRDCTFHYKGILVQKKKNFMQITFKQSTKTHNFLSIDALIELKESLDSAMADPLCHVIVFKGSNNTFCSGLDLRPLLSEQRAQLAVEMVTALGRLVRTLGEISKPVVGAVNGRAIGLGVTLLTHCDVVLASENATFHTPYGQLGYLPEGGGALALSRALGPTQATDLLLRGRPLTAAQARARGLVSSVVPAAQLHQQLLAQVHSMAARNMQALETTKALLRTPMLEKLEESLKKEEELLPSQWLSQSTQQAIQTALDSGVLKE